MGLCCVPLATPYLIPLTATTAAQGYRHIASSRECVPVVLSLDQFFSTSLTWARALQVPLYVCEADKEWYQRFDDIKSSDEVIWFSDKVELGKGVTVVQCGG